MPTFAAWSMRWQQDRTALALMTPATYDMFVAQHLPMQVIARDERRVIVAKPTVADPSAAKPSAASPGVTTPAVANP